MQVRFVLLLSWAIIATAERIGRANVILIVATVVRVTDGDAVLLFRLYRMADVLLIWLEAKILPKGTEN